MRRILLAALLLSGCDSRPATQGDLSDVESVARLGDEQLRSELRTLTQRVEILEKRRADDRELIEANIRDVGSLTNTFNHNVSIENEAAVRRMTAAGACGRETYYPPTGGAVIRNRQCTIKDLRK